MTQRYALRADSWERPKNTLPGRQETVGVTAYLASAFIWLN